MTRITIDLADIEAAYTAAERADAGQTMPSPDAYRAAAILLARRICEALATQAQTLVGSDPASIGEELAHGLIEAGYADELTAVAREPDDIAA